MRRQEVIETLARHRNELTHEYGVRHLALFGSVARDESTDSSDVDLLVEFDDRPIGLFHLIGTKQYLAKLLSVDVDLVLRRSVIPELVENIVGEAIDVFQAEEMEIPAPAYAGGH